MSTLMSGADPMSVEGSPIGVLVLHGFTGNPQSMRPLAEAYAEAGYSVEMPLLRGHGTVIDDMIPTRWEDWSADAEAAYERLAARTEKVVVVGLSMGGSLTLWLASRHPEILGIVCVNPAIDAAEEVVDVLRAMIEEGETIIPGIGSDIAKPDVAESAYPGTPLAPVVSMFEAITALRPNLNKVTAPLLLFTSPEDHVVPPNDSDIVAEAVSGTVERVTCERSYHVATLDYDSELIIERSLAFISTVTA